MVGLATAAPLERAVPSRHAASPDRAWVPDRFQPRGFTRVATGQVGIRDLPMRIDTLIERGGLRTACQHQCNTAHHEGVSHRLVFT